MTGLTLPYVRASLFLTALGAITAGCTKIKEVVDPPPNPVATSLSLGPASPTIDAIGGTLQLTAQVLDQNGNGISGLTASWTGSTPTVATVSNSGLATGVMSGSAIMVATVGAISDSIAVNLTQVAAAIAKLTGDGQTSSIGALLGTNLVAQVNDRLGTAMGPGVGVTFAVGSGGGSVSAPSATTNALGQVGTSWTLGNTSGTQSVSASLTSDGTVTTLFNATATAAAPDSIFGVSGDGQNGTTNSALNDSIVVRVVDPFGNPVPGVAVAFAVTGGNGANSPNNVSTDSNGDAATSWTLGPANGANTLEATSVGLKGSPVAFSATATTLSLSSIAPNPMVEGASITITGTGFDAVPANNSILIDGLAAPVTAASATSLTVTVPARSCKPAADVNVVVTVAGASTPAVQHRIHPVAPLSMSVGQQIIITNPNSFCLQFLPDLVGNDNYLIGVGATNDANASIQYSLVAEAGATSAPGMNPPVAPTQSYGRGTPNIGLDGPFNQEYRLRQWERDNMDPARNPGMWSHLGLQSARAAAYAQMVPNVGDTVMFKVPDIGQNICSNFIPVTTKIRAVGTYGVIAEDITNASTTADTLTQADFDHFSATFDTLIYPVDTTYFGSPTDLDANQRIIMVLTQEVNNFGGIAGFVASVDLVPTTTCASSDLGEIFYGYVPNASTSRNNVMENMLPLIAHEVTHNIQQSRRAAAGSSFMASWEAEGQADLAKEVVGHVVRGNSPGNNYQNVELLAALPGQGGFGWYQQRFTRLALYFGWAGGTSRVTGDPPNECSILGHSQAGIPCLGSYFYGSGWAFHRYINDRFGAAYSGPGGTGETGLERDWIGGTGVSFAGIETLLGVSMDTIFAQFSAMLYADDRVPGISPALQMTSWNMAEIYSSYSSTLSLQPTNQSFNPFTETRQVRMGSTAYTLVSSGGARGALAIRLRDQANGILSAGNKPQIWILRVQ